MAYTLTNLLQDIYSELGQLRVGTATGGTVATLEDSGLASQHSDDEWNGGAVFISREGGDAPNGEYALISGFNASTGAFALASELSAEIEEGDRYALASAYYPLQTLIELANAGLRSLGDIPLVDEDTLLTSESQSSYAATMEWSRRRPMRIDYLAIPGLSAVDPWRTVHDWDFVPAAPGGTSLIIFADALPAGRKLRVWYQAAHPSLRNFDDEVAGAIAPELAVTAGVERALRWQNARLGGSDMPLAGRWDQAQAELANARRSFPVWRPRRAARLLSLRHSRGQR